MRVRRAAQGIHTWGDPTNHSVGDQSVLLPGRDAAGAQLCGGHHAVLIGGDVGEGGNLNSQVGSGQIWRVAGGWPRMSVITSRASALRSSVTKTRAIGSRLVINGLRL